MEPTEDDFTIYEMEVHLALESLEERGFVERFMLDGEEYYKLTPAGIEEAERRAQEMGYESLDEISRLMFGDDEGPSPDLN